MFKVYGKVPMHPNAMDNEYTQMVYVFGGRMLIYNPSSQEARQEDTKISRPAWPLSNILSQNKEQYKMPTTNKGNLLYGIQSLASALQQH